MWRVFFQAWFLALLGWIALCHGEPLTYLDAYEGFTRLRLDASRVATVRKLTFEREAARYDLEDGRLYVGAPVSGRVCAALFIGQGTFSFTPTNEIEAAQLRRFYRGSSLSRDFNVLFLVFSDSTLQEFERRLLFEPAEVPSRAREELTYCLKYITDTEAQYLYTPMAEMFLEGSLPGFFYSHCSESRTEPLFFQIDPSRFEEVAFLRRPADTGMRHRHEIVCQFPRRHANVSRERVYAVNTLHAPSYRIECTFAEDLELTATAEVEIRSDREVSWIHLALYEELVVDSLRWEGGPSVEHFKGKHNPNLWIQCDPPLRAGESRVLRVTYHGKLIQRVGDLFYVDSYWDWYPTPIYSTGRYHPESRSRFDLTYHVPEQFDLISVGRQISTSSANGIVPSRWSVETPVLAAGFGIGFFEELPVEDARIPPLTVYTTEGLLRKGGAVDKDVTESIAVFQQLFGACPIDALRVMEIPTHGGRAYPGLVQLSAFTFVDSRPTPVEEVLRAHEVAHQWWGTAVGFETYHDQWISEAFAEYAGLWYMQLKRGNETFFDALRQLRRRIVDNRDFLFGKGQEAGPIWLGSRVEGSQTWNDYSVIVYSKGAWVLHMLRCMLMDIKNMDEKRFLALMMDFFASYNGKSPSTQDFRRVVEKYAGQDMGWFFDQWVYGTAIPTYEFDQRMEKLESGNWLVHCRVRQTGVPEDFQMYVPIRIDFDNDRYVRFRVFLKGPLSEFDLPELPEKPKAVVFHDFESVLCEIK
ncbi:MAG TPA: M1 family aminopeptidase [Candidatus Krumholzibacteria bacterium]|nr:M1 family aminopeptidase [Candidatus Krumholzibacteria bacterium]